MIKYFNTKICNEVETFDHIDSDEFKSYKEFKHELNAMRMEYAKVYDNFYVSSRGTKDYRDQMNYATDYKLSK